MNYTKLLQDIPKLDFYFDEILNVNLSYCFRYENDKPVLLLLHGFNGNSKSWACQFKYFENKRSVLAIDFPGFGGSEFVELDMISVAELLTRFLENIKVTRCDVLGHSMGGMLAQIFCSNNYGLTNKVILSCTHKGFCLPKGTPLVENYQKRIKERLIMSDIDFGELRISEMLPGLENKEIFNFLSLISGEITEESIKCGGMAMQTLDTTNYLSKLNQDCLIIKASKDIVVPKQRSQELEKLLQHAKIIEFQNVGHAPYCENAKLFNTEIENFLQ
mgnify:FL=1